MFNHHLPRGNSQRVAHEGLAGDLEDHHLRQAMGPWDVSAVYSFITFMEVIHEKMCEHSIAFPCFPEIDLKIKVKVVIVQFGSGKTSDNNTKPMNDVSHKIG